MTIEVANTIAELDSLLPANGDFIFEGDNHIRLIKKVIKQAFPGDLGAGFDQAIIAYETELNFVSGVVSLIQDQLDALHLGKVPVKGIILYSGSIGSIPSNFQVCNGTNGTPNLANQIIYGTNTEGQLGDTGGTNNANIQDHTHNFTHGHSGSSLAADGAHSHTYQSSGDWTGSASSDLGIGGLDAAIDRTVVTSAAGSHGHTTTINNDNTDLGNALDPVTSGAAGDGVGDNLPPYYRLAHIMRLS